MKYLILSEGYKEEIDGVSIEVAKMKTANLCEKLGKVTLLRDENEKILQVSHPQKGINKY